MAFSILPVNAGILHLKYEYRARNESRFSLLRHVVPLDDGSFRLTIPVKGRCTRGVLPHVFHIGVFKFVKTIFTKIKHIYKESANIIEGCNVTFDTHDCWNPQ